MYLFDARTHMRPVMSRQEAETLLDKVGGLQGQPCAARGHPCPPGILPGAVEHP